MTLFWHAWIKFYDWFNTSTNSWDVITTNTFIVTITCVKYIVLFINELDKHCVKCKIAYIYASTPILNQYNNVYSKLDSNPLIQMCECNSMSTRWLISSQTRIVNEWEHMPTYLGLAFEGIWKRQDNHRYKDMNGVDIRKSIFTLILNHMNGGDVVCHGWSSGCYNSIRKE